MRLIVAILVALVTYVYAGDYMVGKGVGDITGPSVQINFMGYALPGQRGTGIHLRTFARAFVVSDGDKKVAIVNMDCGMGSDLIKHQVIDALTAKFPDGRYGQNNVLLTGTHTHSAPGGFQQYVLYQITSLGWVEETTSAQVAGIVAAIIEADGNMEAADISVVSDKLFEANINRSPTSYLLNPADERARFAEDGDTDKDMTLVRFDRKSGAGGRHKGMQRGAQGASGPLGMMNFFAVHGTSMNNTNTLVSGDNKGFAAYTVERAHNGDDVLPGNGDFVAAFVSTNLGDVSPNTKGPHCIDTGEPCDAYHSTCDGKCENCIASGPGRDMTESTAIIGQKQADMASSLFERAGDRSQTAASSTGTVDFRHSFVKMKGRNVTYTDVESGELKWSYLCTPAMGYAFAAGTTDGPGMFNFEQGTTTGNMFWDHVRDFLSEPTPEEEKCQAPKPILLNTGDVEEPHAWDPATVPVQIVRVGGLFILAAPCELTTMAGRRVRDAVRPYLQQLVDREAQALGAEEGETVAVVIAGLANAYSSYVTTFEEYQAQRYEAASTIYGPHTLSGYIQEFVRLASDMSEGRASDTDAAPIDYSNDMLGYIKAPFNDEAPPLGYEFGSVTPTGNAKPVYNHKSGAIKELLHKKTGKDMGEDEEEKPLEVSVEFFSGNPRNGLKPGGGTSHIPSYMDVQRLGKDGEWTTVYTDANWQTKFEWHVGARGPFEIETRKGGHARATLRWFPDESDRGTFRICHYGDYRLLDMNYPKPYKGCSRDFRVV